MLLQGVEGSGPGGFFFEGQVHAFMAPVLLRLSGLDAFDADAEAQPPDRQGAEAEQGIGGGEGDTVIGADGLGEPIGVEGLLEDRACEGGFCRVQGFTGRAGSGSDSR